MEVWQPLMPQGNGARRSKPGSLASLGNPTGGLWYHKLVIRSASVSVQISCRVFGFRATRPSRHVAVKISCCVVYMTWRPAVIIIVTARRERWQSNCNNLKTFVFTANILILFKILITYYYYYIGLGENSHEHIWSVIEKKAISRQASVCLFIVYICSFYIPYIYLHKTSSFVNNFQCMIFEM